MLKTGLTDSRLPAFKTDLMAELHYFIMGKISILHLRLIAKTHYGKKGGALIPQTPFTEDIVSSL